MPTQRKKYDLPAVERIELSERRFPLRAVLAGLGVVVMLVLLGVAVNGLLGPATGWRAIESDGSRGVHCGGDFVFNADVDSVARAKALTLAYTEATARAYALFDVTSIDQVEPNLAYLNAHPGEDVTLDPALYRALVEATAAGRYLFLAPIYDVHRSLCGCQDDSETAAFDALQDGDVAAFCAAATAYARDEDSVSLTFPAENVARLTLSEEYAAFLKDNGCPGALDFGWMKNAFILDTLVDAARQAGLERGVIASRDGFVRGVGDAAFSVERYRPGQGRGVADGKMSVDGGAAVVSLRAFPAEAGDGNYYVFRDGSVRGPHIDPEDGMAREAMPSLTGISKDLTCGELLAKLLPLYIAPDFAPESALEKVGEGVTLVYPTEDGWINTDEM